MSIFSELNLSTARKFSTSLVKHATRVLKPRRTSFKARSENYRRGDESKRLDLSFALWSDFIPRTQNIHD